MSNTVSRKSYKDTIRKLQASRSSKVIVYVTGEKKPANLFATQIAMDVLDLFFLHLKKMRKSEKVSLLLHTSGGHLSAPWPLVNLLREFCEKLEILIPVKALSAGTLLCMGADKIVMTSRSNLGPVDPRGIFQVEGKRMDVQIEDIMGYLRFVKEKVGLKDQSFLTEALKELTSKVPPQVLGSIERTHAFIGKLSKDLLRLHMKDEKRIDEIVNNLTQNLFYHQHLISRKEARDSVGFGNRIEFADGENADIIDKCFNLYTRELELDTIFDAEAILSQNEYQLGGDPVKYTVTRAIIESERELHKFESDVYISKDQDNQIKINTKFSGWR